MCGRPFSPYTKEEIKDREEHKCFYCGSKKDLTIAHTFVWKKDDGLPVKENGICLCRTCHDKMDFGIGCTREEQIHMLRLCEMYLILTYMKELNPMLLTDRSSKQKRMEYTNNHFKKKRAS